MGKIRRTFTLEFKQALAAQILSGQVSASQAAREHQLSMGMIHRWKEQYQRGTLDGASTRREHQLERENQFLKEKVAELYLQVELLKKVQNSRRFPQGVSISVITSSSLNRSKGGAR